MHKCVQWSDTLASFVLMIYMFTHRPEDPSHVQSGNVEEGLVANLLALLPLFGRKTTRTVLVQRPLLLEHVVVYNRHGHRQEYNDGPGIGIQERQTKHTVVGIVSLGVVGQAGCDPADPAGPVIKLEDQPSDAGAEADHDGQGMQILFNSLDSLFLPSAHDDQQVVNRQADVVRRGAKRGALVEESLRGAGLDGSRGQEGLAAGDRPGR